MRKKPNRHTVQIDANVIGIGGNKAALLSHDPLIKFSYKYLDLGHEKFNIEAQEAIYFFKCIQRLKGLSTYKVSELKASRSKSLRFHDIDWEDTTEIRFGIPNEAEMFDKPWQFEVSVNEHGRVHGFFIGNVFYIVWFDPDHALYA